MTSLRPKVLALGTFAAYRNHDVCLDAHTMLTSLSCYHATSKYLTGTMLDGGGVRGWTQILLLERITREIKSLLEKVEKDQIREEDLYPSEYFVCINPSCPNSGYTTMSQYTIN